mgnify:CR=1 FL=1
MTSFHLVDDNGLGLAHLGDPVPGADWPLQASLAVTFQESFWLSERDGHHSELVRLMGCQVNDRLWFMRMTDRMSLDEAFFDRRPKVLLMTFSPFEDYETTEHARPYYP